MDLDSIATFIRTGVRRGAILVLVAMLALSPTLPFLAPSLSVVSTATAEQISSPVSTHEYDETPPGLEIGTDDLEHNLSQQYSDGAFQFRSVGVLNISGNTNNAAVRIQLRSDGGKSVSIRVRDSDGVDAWDSASARYCDSNGCSVLQGTGDLGGFWSTGNLSFYMEYAPQNESWHFRLEDETGGLYKDSSEMNLGWHKLALRPSDLDSIRYTVAVGSNWQEDVSLNTSSSHVHAYSQDLRYNIERVKISGIPAGRTVSGHVRTQTGAPVANATVELYGSVKPTAAKARDHLTKIADQSPPEIPDRLDSLQLLGATGELQSLNTKYPLVYTPDQIGTAPWVDSADLTDPLTRSVPPDRTLAIVVGDAGANPGFIASTGEYNRQLPGAKSSGTVVIERIGPNNETTDRYTVTTTKTAGGGFGDPTTLKYATVSLPTGFYRVHVQGSSFSYPIQVGSATAIIDQYLEDTQGQLTDAAQQVRDAISGGSLIHKTVTTNASGYWSATIPTGAKVVQVQAYKAPGIDAAPSSLTLGEIRQNYSAQNPPQASIYLPSRVKRVDVPSQDVTIRLREVSWPPASNLTRLQDRLENLTDRLQNQAQNVAALLKTVGNQSLATLRARYSELAGLVRANPALRQRYLELSGRDTIPDAADLSKSELQTQIGYLNQALTTAPATPVRPPDPPDISGGTITQEWTIPNIDPTSANVSIIAHYSNGTTAPVPQKYIQTEDDLVGAGGTVILDGFPLGETDPAAVSFSLTVASESGVARGESQVTNPSFNGTLPALASIELSTLAPGPDDTVTIQVHPAAQSGFDRITSATAYAPDGTVVATNVTTDDTVRFETESRGTHVVEITMTTAGGTEFVETVRVRASAADINRPPSIRTASSASAGVYAVVGDGFETGDVTVSGTRVQVTGQIATDADAPAQIHVYTDALSTSADAPIEIQVVRGDSQQAVRKHLYVTAHIQSLPSSGIVWRGRYDGFGGVDEQPLTRSGTPDGSIEVQDNQTVVSTYTSSQASVTVDPSPSPGWGEQLTWTLDTDLPSVDVPGIGS